MSAKDIYLIAYIVLLLLGRTISQGQRKAKNITEQTKGIYQDPTAVIMALGAIVGFSLPVVEAATRETLEIKTFATIAGVIFILAGWAIAYFANRVIAENWSPSIEKDGNQQLITLGIYAFVRHPLYLSGLLIFTGTNIYFLNTWSWIATGLLFVVVLWRIPIEDRKLEAMFGDAYSEYRRNTKAIIPWIY